MENREPEKRPSVSIDQGAPIQVLVSSPDAGETEIDLGQVFLNFKNRRRLFGWVLVLCVVVGLSVPLLMYQFSHPMLTVASVVSLDYDILVPDPELEPSDPNYNNPEYMVLAPVSDLTAPDGEPLDLGQVTSSYVLQSALNGMPLSQPITMGALQNNLKVTRILTEDSRRNREVLSTLLENKNTSALTEAQNLTITYQNRFIVSLTNGFGAEDDRVKVELEEGELRQLLDRILTAYNTYMVNTYLDPRLPDDQLSIIDTENLDILESLDQLRDAEKNLYAYCEEKPDNVRAYRSGRTGKSLEDWMEDLDSVTQNNIDYLYSFVYANNVVLDQAAMLNNYRYQLRNAQSELDELNANIAATQEILDSYKNDDVFVSLQESDSSRSTRISTAYYNELTLLQADQFEQAATLKTTIEELNTKIQHLEANASSADQIETAKAELATAIAATQQAYQGIYSHMDEYFASAESAHFVSHSVAQGREDNFLVASAKKMIIGAVAGAVIACGLWFLAALAPEFRKKKDEPGEGKEAARA